MRFVWTKVALSKPSSYKVVQLDKCREWTFGSLFFCFLSVRVNTQPKLFPPPLTFWRYWGKGDGCRGFIPTSILTFVLSVCCSVCSLVLSLSFCCLGNKDAAAERSELCVDGGADGQIKHTISFSSLGRNKLKMELW